MALSSWKYSTMILWVFLGIFCSFYLTTSAQASELQIEIVDSWVEEGYIFHVDIQLPPYQDYCTATGRGYIGFNVYYEDTRSLKEEWTFGIAPWPGEVVSDSQVGSHITAVGPQVNCTKFSPCTIQGIQIVKAWCPPLEEASLYAE